MTTQPEAAMTREQVLAALKKYDVAMDQHKSLYHGNQAGINQAVPKLVEIVRALASTRQEPAPAADAEWPDHTLHSTDLEVLERQRARLDDFSEGWTEAARQYSVEENENGDRMMMRLSHIFNIASNEITAVLRQADARAKSGEKGGADV